MHDLQIHLFPFNRTEEESKEDSTIVSVLKCFSVNINGRAVLNTDSGGEGHIACLNGLRYFSLAEHYRYIFNVIVLLAIYDWRDKVKSTIFYLYSDLQLPKLYYQLVILVRFTIKTCLLLAKTYF